jgi:hypothetical protein
VPQRTASTLAQLDGGTQITDDGMPLYYFMGHSRPGDTIGQGKDGVFACSAAGSPNELRAPVRPIASDTHESVVNCSLRTSQCGAAREMGGFESDTGD